MRRYGLGPQCCRITSLGFVRRTVRFSERLLAELARRAGASSAPPLPARTDGVSAPACAAMGTEAAATEERNALLAEMQSAMDDADEERLAGLVERATALGLGAERLVGFCRKLLDRLAEQRAC